MTRHKPQVDLGIDGPSAPPRRNGELAFAAPWESRVFGLAVALEEQGLFEWREFQQSLIAEIRRWESENEAARGDFRYYDHWQAALERLLERKGICSAAELDDRARALADRPPGHDHDGNVVARFESKVKPEDPAMTEAIEKLLR